MSELINKRTWREDKNNLWVLEERKDSQDNTMWVLFLEQYGKLMQSTVQVRRRLNSDLKEDFKIK